MNQRRDMPYVGERCLFVRRLSGGEEFYFYGQMTDAKTVKMLLYGTEVDWFLIARWKYEDAPYAERE